MIRSEFRLVRRYTRVSEFDCRSDSEAIVMEKRSGNAMETGVW